MDGVVQMSNHWFRLWHDFSTNAKFRIIAKAADRPLSMVHSMFVRMLIDASRNVTRGHVTVTFEVMACDIDVTERDIAVIWKEMQGRVLDGNRLTGWEKRQPQREDQGNEKTGAKSAAQRKREQREREKSGKQPDRQRPPKPGLEQGSPPPDASRKSHAESRRVTTRGDKDKDKETPPYPPQAGGHGGGDWAEPTKAEAICRAVEAMGITGADPSDLTLQALIDRGVQVGAFEAAAALTLKAGTAVKHWSYLLAILRRQVGDAARITAGPALQQSAWDATRSSIEAMGLSLGIGQWNEADLSANRETFEAYTQRVRRRVEASPVSA